VRARCASPLALGARWPGFRGVDGVDGADGAWASAVADPVVIIPAHKYPRSKRTIPPPASVQKGRAEHSLAPGLRSTADGASRHAKRWANCCKRGCRPEFRGCRSNVFAGIGELATSPGCPSKWKPISAVSPARKGHRRGRPAERRGPAQSQPRLIGTMRAGPQGVSGPESYRRYRSRSTAIGASPAPL
jgi:hypothetical protein